MTDSSTERERQRQREGVITSAGLTLEKTGRLRDHVGHHHTCEVEQFVSLRAAEGWKELESLQRSKVYRAGDTITVFSFREGD